MAKDTAPKTDTAPETPAPAPAFRVATRTSLPKNGGRTAWHMEGLKEALQDLDHDAAVVLDTTEADAKKLYANLRGFIDRHFGARSGLRVETLKDTDGKPTALQVVKSKSA